jgi:hypothetical protein
VISARGRGSPAAGRGGRRHVTDEQIVASASALLPMVPRACWRRHLAPPPARPRSAAGSPSPSRGRASSGWWASPTWSGGPRCPSRSGTTSLALILDQFEQLAYDVVTGRARRVVKMIGDEVMFTGRGRGRGRDRPGAVERRPGVRRPVRGCGSGIATGRCWSGRATCTAGGQPGQPHHRCGLPGDHRGERGPAQGAGRRPALPSALDAARYLKDFGRMPLWVLRAASAGDGRAARRDG